MVASPLKVHLQLVLVRSGLDGFQVLPSTVDVHRQIEAVALPVLSEQLQQLRVALRAEKALSFSPIVTCKDLLSMEPPNQLSVTSSIAMGDTSLTMSESHEN